MITTAGGPNWPGVEGSRTHRTDVAWPPIEVLAGLSLVVLAASAALGVAGALYPAWKASGIDPVEVMVNE